MVPNPKIRHGLSNAYLPFLYGLVSRGDEQITFGANFTIERKPTGVRLILANYSSEPQILAGVCAAASASATSTTTPVDAAGTPSAWHQATIAGGALALPAGAAGAPSYVLTDLMPIEGLDRTDSGRGYLLYTRAASPPDGYVALTTQSVTFATLNAALGRDIAQYFAPGDAASTGQSALTDASVTGSGFQTFYVVGVVFLCEDRCITIGMFGDSLTGGHLTDGEYAGCGRIAVNLLSSPQCGASFVDGNYPGQTMSVICNRARVLTAAGIPLHVAVVPIDSPNDYTSNVGYQDRVGQETTALSLIHHLQSLGITVIVLTALPYGPYGVDPWNEARLVSSAKARKLEQLGVVVMDVAEMACGFVPTSERPAAVPVRYLASDHAHYNDALQALLGLNLQQLVGSLLEERS